MEVQRRKENIYFEAQQQEECREAEDWMDQLEAHYQPELAMERGGGHRVPASEDFTSAIIPYHSVSWCL